MCIRDRSGAVTSADLTNQVGHRAPSMQCGHARCCQSIPQCTLVGLLAIGHGPTAASGASFDVQALFPRRGDFQLATRHTIRGPDWGDSR
eukprot:3574804-Prymnesium_polylepis.5